MSIPGIILLLMATLTMVVVGCAVLVKEQGRRNSLAFMVVEDGTSTLNRLRRGIERRALATTTGQGLRRQLRNADVHRPIADVILGGVGVFVGVGYLSYTIGGPVLAGLALGMLVMGARAWFRRREEARLSKFIDQLPDLARLLANATDAGLSLRAALGVAAQETIEPVKGELERVNEELALGSPIEEALGRMGDRLPSRELAVLVNVLMIQTRAGGRVVTALRGVTEALETRRDLRREVATLIAGSKATVLAVSGLGALMVWIVHTSVEGGLRALLANPIGLIIFLVSVGLFAFGIVLTRRAANVEI